MLSFPRALCLLLAVAWAQALDCPDFPDYNGCTLGSENLAKGGAFNGGVFRIKCPNDGGKSLVAKITPNQSAQLKELRDWYTDKLDLFARFKQAAKLLQGVDGVLPLLAVCRDTAADTTITIMPEASPISDWSVDCLRQVQKALANLRAKKLLHSDVKADNIMAYKGHCVLVDHDGTCNTPPQYQPGRAPPADANANAKGGSQANAKSGSQANAGLANNNDNSKSQKGHSATKILGKSQNAAASASASLDPADGPVIPCTISEYKPDVRGKVGSDEYHLIQFMASTFQVDCKANVKRSVKDFTPSIAAVDDCIKLVEEQKNAPVVQVSHGSGYGNL